MDAAVIAAVVSLLIAGLTIGADRYRERRQARLKRFNELRDVLDRAAAALTAALYAFGRRASAPESERKSTGEAFDSAVEEVEVMEARIAIRLGEDHPARESYGEVLKRLEKLSTLIWEAHGDLTGERKVRATSLRKDVAGFRREYLDEARRLVAKADA